jgi:hypothetical protein
VLVVKYFIEHVDKAGLGLILVKVQELLPDQTLPAMIADVHFVIAADCGVRTHNMAEQAGVGAHMAEQEYMTFRRKNCYTLRQVRKRAE